ncbi:MAG: hypothetical protein J6I50_08985 [Clostridia bacterium]|nr:hypothetical protein [Clostridia bacterium]
MLPFWQTEYPFWNRVSCLFPKTVPGQAALQKARLAGYRCFDTALLRCGAAGNPFEGGTRQKSREIPLLSAIKHKARGGSCRKKAAATIYQEVPINESENHVGLQ